jgi:hypothetical protein
MEQIVVQIRDKEKAKVLLELLTALDFVDSVQSMETGPTEGDPKILEGLHDFFSLAGLWQDRDVSLEAIRLKAWPRQST